MKTMKKNQFLVRLALVIALSVGKTAVANPFILSYTTENQNTERVRYVDVVFEKVNIQRDIVFGESINEKGEKELLKLDVYAPEADEMQNRPVIVWIHGGGFRPGNDKTQSYIVEMANRFSRKGYVCLSVDYRLR